MPLDPTPVPAGPEFSVVPATATYFQYNPAAAALPGRGFVVAYQKSDPAAVGDEAKYFSSDVYARFYTPTGVPAGDEFRVNDYRTDFQGSPRVAVLADGGFAVVWASTEPGERFALDVHVRSFAADGTPAGDEVRAHGALGGNQAGAEITALADGSFVITWEGPASAGGGDAGIYARRFGADGAPAGDEFRVDGASGGSRGSADVAALADGGFVVAWEHADPSGGVFDSFDVYARRFGADGAPASDEFRVHLSPDGDQDDPEVAGLADGGFVVTWQTAAAEPGRVPSFDAYDVHGRRFAADGAPIGGEFRVHDAAGGFQSNHGVWVTADGRFAATWYDNDLSEANGLGIYARLFEAPGASTPPTPPTVPSKAGISAVASSQSEGDAGATAAFTFDVTLDATPSTPQSVWWQVEGRGARAADATDFAGGVLPSGELVFAAGETRKTVTVHVAGGAVVEGDEGFAVMLLLPSGGLVVGAHESAAATILDDDMPASAPPAHAAKVMRLYEAALDRLPDRGGFEFWVGALQKGEALSSLASGFLASEEFAARFGAASADDAAFVDRLYQNVLGRAGEAEGRAFWCDSLGKGSARAEVLAAFSESAEHVALTADLYGGGSGLLIA